MSEHVLKTYDYLWDAIQRGEKTYEIRRNDRGFQTGDVVILRRTSQSGGGTSWFINSPRRGEYRDLRFRIGFILQGGQFGIDPCYCIFSLLPEERFP